LIACQSVRASRLVVEECFKWAVQRKVFGRPLIAQPVIRQKLAHMVSQVEAVQSWLENVTYQMTKLSYAEQAVKLAGPIALLKLQCTRVGQFISDESCQVFGGRAITQTGMGQIVERYHRGSKFAAILGGSEEIMADLGIKQALKMFPQNARL
jgi:alkylation response protein AidB-like acyl-CoA dehydrogenase